MSMLGGGAYSASPTKIRAFLRAKTPQGLVQAQLENNLKHRAYFSYTDFSQGKDGFWYCWFLVDVNEFEGVNGPTK